MYTVNAANMTTKRQVAPFKDARRDSKPHKMRNALSIALLTGVSLLSPALSSRVAQAASPAPYITTVTTGANQVLVVSVHTPGEPLNEQPNTYKLTALSNSGKGKVVLRQTYTQSQEIELHPQPDVFTPPTINFEYTANGSPALGMKPSQTDELIFSIINKYGKTVGTAVGLATWKIDTGQIWFKRPYPIAGQSDEIYAEVPKKDMAGGKTMELSIGGSTDIYSTTKNKLSYPWTTYTEQQVSSLKASSVFLNDYLQNNGVWYTVNVTVNVPGSAKPAFGMVERIFVTYPGAKRGPND